MLKQKFNELCQNLKLELCKDGNSLTNLELRLFSADELWDTGFISKEIFNLMMNVCKFIENPIIVEEYFESECKNIISEKLFDIRQIFNSKVPIDANILCIKINTVSRTLENNLYLFLKEIKADIKRQKNKTSNSNNNF